MLSIITSKQEIRDCQKKLFALLNNYKTGKQNLYLGTRGGGEEKLLTYSNELNIWWCADSENNDTHYWNAFGIGGKPDTLNQDYFIEINYPFEGVNKRVAALWAKDSWGNIFLLHSGKMGGGKKGMTIDFFFKNYNGKFDSLNHNGQTKEYVIIGCLQDELFPYQVSEYIKEVYRIKSIPVSSNTKKIGPAKFTFNDEFFGNRKTYSLPNEVAANCNHGLVVSELASIFYRNKLEFANDQQNDIFILNSRSKTTHLFEIKTAISLQNIYTAVGQLYLNSKRLVGNPQLVFVCPAYIQSRIVDDLESIDISTLTYTWSKGKPIFKNIDKILDVR